MSGEIDSWVVERDGVKYSIDIDPDYESNREGPAANDEGARDETIEAHKRGDWLYVGVTVLPLIDGLDAARYSPLVASLWCVEWGMLPATSAEGLSEDDFRFGSDSEAVEIGREYIADTYPGPDLVAEARGNLRDLRDRLAALGLDDCPAEHVRTEGIREPATVRCERAAGHEMPHRVMDYEWTD